MMNDSSFNEMQLEAVNWDGGPALVRAGPGSGKTRVLTHRIARLIEESAGDDFNILGLTFTDRAAAEMRKRVHDLVPDADERISLTTFHAFSAAILRQHGSHLGIRSDFTILSQDADRIAVLDDAIARADLVCSENYTSERLLPLMTRMTDECVPADAAADRLQAESQDNARWVGNVYAHYRRLMVENNMLDFSTVLAEALRLLDEPAGCRLIRRIYPYVCVDEFQDTSMAQYQMLRRVVDPDTKNLFVVADENQLIFEWNGAAMKRLKTFQDQFEPTVFELPINYRCPPSVVEVANRLIAHNPRHGKADSIPNKPSGIGCAVQVKKFNTDDEEVDWVARDIAKRHAESQDTFAILARTRIALKQAVAALNRHGLHGYLHANKKEFTNDRMVWLHSVLRLANSRLDKSLLRRVCKSFYVIEGVDLIADEIASKAEMSNSDYLKSWIREVQSVSLDETTNVFWNNTMSKLADKLDVQEFIQDCFEWFELRQKADPAPDYETDYKEEMSVLEALMDEVANDAGGERVGLGTLLQHMDLRSKTTPVPEGAIPCYTIYASKGTEFDHIYLIRLSEDELPHWRAAREGDQSSQMQEERRVCFVAITRTQKSLMLTYPLHVSGSVKKPSRFLAEMGMMQD